MSWLFPHPPYAEDQPLSHQILYFHTIRSGAMMGAIIAQITAPSMAVVERYRHNTQITRSTLGPRLFTHSARGIFIGSIFAAVATWGRMRAKEEIEWQDRAWRVIENTGQVDMDRWTLVGAALGSSAGLWGARQGKTMSMGKAALGGAGVG
ncbi:hypothetical protein BCR34DRAFT_450070, partial [Clohesyomyces aquaticus]